MRYLSLFLLSKSFLLEDNNQTLFNKFRQKKKNHGNLWQIMSKIIIIKTQEKKGVEILFSYVRY